MADRDAIIRGYAAALFAVAEAEGASGSVEDELFAFAKAVEGSGELRDVLTDPALPAERRRAVVRDLMGERASPHSVNLVGFVIEQGRAKDLQRIIEELVRTAAERRRHRVAEVRSAVALTERQRESLAAALSEATGQTVEVKPVVDPSVIGGVVATVGDEVFDGSVRTRLRQVRERLGSM